MSKQYMHARLKQIEALLVTEMTIPEVMKATGLGDSAARHYVEMLYDQKRVHISGWRLGKGSNVRKFKAGRAEDAPVPPRPPRPSDYVPTGRPRGGRRASKPVPIAIAPDPLMAALFGRRA